VERVVFFFFLFLFVGWCAGFFVLGGGARGEVKPSYGVHFPRGVGSYCGWWEVVTELWVGSVVEGLQCRCVTPEKGEDEVIGGTWDVRPPPFGPFPISSWPGQSKPNKPPICH
jgi:hypothetical protein